MGKRYQLYGYRTWFYKSLLSKLCSKVLKTKWRSKNC